MTLPKKARELLEESGAEKRLGTRAYKLLRRDKTRKQGDEIIEMMRQAQLEIKLSMYLGKTSDEDLERIMRQHILELKGLLYEQDEKRKEMLRLTR